MHEREQTLGRPLLSQEGQGQGRPLLSQEGQGQGLPSQEGQGQEVRLRVEVTERSSDTLMEVNSLI